MNYKRILAIGAHVGDMELTCGGILATCSVSGGHVATLALTAGEKGAPAGVDPARYRVQKVAEAAAFAGMLGGESYVLDYADGLLPDNDEVRFAVCDIIRAEKPDLIVTHHEKSMHKDHAACHRIVCDAWYYAAIDGFRRKLPPHFAPLRFAENWEDSVDYRPFEYFPVSEEGFALWQKAVRTHWFVTGSSSFPYLEYYSHLKRLRGIEARRPYAETFMRLPEEYRIVSPL